MRKEGQLKGGKGGRWGEGKIGKRREVGRGEDWEKKGREVEKREDGREGGRRLKEGKMKLSDRGSVK